MLSSGIYAPRIEVLKVSEMRTVLNALGNIPRSACIEASKPSARHGLGFIVTDSGSF